MKVGFLITARLKSTRLERKLVLKIFNTEMIRYMIRRLKLSSALDLIVICTSPNPQDSELIQIAKEEKVEYFLGDEDDVFKRLTDAAEKFNLDFAINVSADNPLVSLEYIKEIRDYFEKTNADHIRCMDLPIGLFSYGLKPAAMRKICETKESKQTEVWGRYFTESELFTVLDIVIPKKYQRNYRLTIDYPEDFKFLEAIFSHFGEETYKVTLDELISFLDNNPEVVSLNSDRQKEYEERIAKQRKLAT